LEKWLFVSAVLTEPRADLEAYCCTLLCIILSLSLHSDGPWNRYEPEAYKNAYRRIVDVLRTSGVKNFAAVWQSATSSFGTFGNRSILDWWPGDAYVDWAGLSYFVPHPPSLGALLDAARFKGVPVLICESAPQGYDLARGTVASTTNGAQDRRAASADETWGKWFAPFFAFIRENYDVIRGVSYVCIGLRVYCVDGRLVVCFVGGLTRVLFYVARFED
jgi:hypothetical protein